MSAMGWLNWWTITALSTLRIHRRTADIALYVRLGVAQLVDNNRVVHPTFTSEYGGHRPLCPPWGGSIGGQ